MARLATGLAAMGVEAESAPLANMAFFDVPPDVIDAWAAAGIDFYRMAEDRVRLVTSFRSTPEEIDEALGRMAAALDVWVRKFDGRRRTS